MSAVPSPDRVDYYRRRAATYERVYHEPVRAAALACAQGFEWTAWTHYWAAAWTLAR